MAKRAEAALGSSQEITASPTGPFLMSLKPSAPGFMLALGTRPEHEAVDSTLPDGSPCSGF